MDMANALMFDSLKDSKRLVEAGFTEPQAEALAEEQSAVINDQLATKRDIAEVRRAAHSIHAAHAVPCAIFCPQAFHIRKPN